jgi:hypothetical protein
MESSSIRSTLPAMVNQPLSRATRMASWCSRDRALIIRQKVLAFSEMLTRAGANSGKDLLPLSAEDHTSGLFEHRLTNGRLCERRAGAAGLALCPFTGDSRVVSLLIESGSWALVSGDRIG